MSKTILVVDDAAFMRLMVSDIVKKGGYTVIGEAENGQKAIEKYKKLRPDIVMMDITMPDMNGIAAVKEIKKIDANAKIIICSAMGQQETVTKAIQAGAINFIVKPFIKEKILEVIEQSFTNK